MIIEDSTTQNSKVEPENGNPKRTRSTISFPYIALGGCLEVAAAVHEVGGDACEWNQVAAHLRVSAQGGAFRQKMLAAKTFGLIDYSGQDVTLTELGQRCIDENTTKGGCTDAFLHVPLFRQLFDRFDGIKTPPHAAIQRAMGELGVAPKQTAKARQAFIKSAREAGFFDINPDRLTKPSVEPSGKTPLHNAKGSSSNGDGGDPPIHHPLINALLAQMPPAEKGWEQAQCVVWLRTLLASISMIYKASFEELQEIQIMIREQRDL